LGPLTKYTTLSCKFWNSIEELMASQELYDNHFLDSPVWRAARG